LYELNVVDRYLGWVHKVAGEFIEEDSLHYGLCQEDSDGVLLYYQALKFVKPTSTATLVHIACLDCLAL
jgi:hypothetical protein